MLVLLLLIIVVKIITSGFPHTQCLATHETQMLQPTFIILTMLNVPPSSKPYTILFLHFQGRHLHFGLSESSSHLPTTTIGLHFLYLFSHCCTTPFPSLSYLWRSLPLGAFQMHFVTPGQTAHMRIFHFHHPVLLQVVTEPSHSAELKQLFVPK